MLTDETEIDVMMRAGTGSVPMVKHTTEQVRRKSTAVTTCSMSMARCSTSGSTTIRKDTQHQEDLQQTTLA